MRQVTMPGDYIIRQGDIGDEMFFTRSGACEVVITGVGVVGTKEAGNFFGEIRRGPRDAFGVFGATFWKLEWKTSKFSGRAVPKTPNASYCHYVLSFVGTHKKFLYTAERGAAE
jgi:hypothetical protein